jgi:hypothetical protein
MMRKLLVVGVLFLAACTGDRSAPATPTLEPVAIVRPLATVAPTATLSDADRIATLTAVPESPTPIRPTATPTPTPYIGVFIGEAGADPFVPFTDFDAQQLVFEPTDPPGVRLICDIPENPAFGDAWREPQRVVNELRCPIQIMVAFDGILQIFERGAMYHRPETGEVWAVAPGRPGSVGDYWYLGNTPANMPPVLSDPPAGRFIPEGALGVMWSTINPVQESLGFGLQEPIPDVITVQRFTGGSLLLDTGSDQVFAFLLDGSAYGPYPAPPAPEDPPTPTGPTPTPVSDAP